jgi:mannosyltransferase
VSIAASSSAAAEAPVPEARARAAEAAWVKGWWPLAAIVVLAAVLRLATLGQQSLWFDEAFTPLHVFHASLWRTLSSVARTEDTPPLWYVLDWAITRVFGTGLVALRMLSALAGIATVPVAWAIARRLAGSRAALATALLVAVSPLLVWYSQEARAYGLFVLLAAVAMLCFLRALESPTPGRVGQFALSGSLALLTHYFAVFLLAPMVVCLGGALLGRLRQSPRAHTDQRPATRGSALAPSPVDVADAPCRRGSTLALVAAPVLVGVALLPLALVQASHDNTQWIDKLSLQSKLEAIPQYYLTGYSGAPLGRGIELLVALPALAGIAYGLWRGLSARERGGAAIALGIAACGVLVPVALAIVGLDYLAPRNVVAAMVPVTVAIAIPMASARAGAVGVALTCALAIAFAAVTLDTYRNARLQRGDWRGLAKVLESAEPDHAITTLHLGTAPLRYYIPSLRTPAAGRASLRLREIDETGYPPLRASAGQPPPGGFQLVQRRDIKGLLVYRFVSRRPVTISAQRLRQDGIAVGQVEVLVPAGV